VAIVTGYVGAERSGNAGNQRLGIRNIERGCNARDVNQIARPTEIAVEGFASVETIYARVRFTRIAEAECRAAPTVKYAERRFGVKWSWSEPRKLAADITQTFWSECAREDDGVVYESPLVWVLRIMAAKIRKELAHLGLKVEGQRGGKQVGFF